MPYGPHPRRPQNELQETPLALPPLYRKAELEMNFPSSAAGRVDGTGDEEAGRPPTSTSAQMDELQETSRAVPVTRSTFAQRDATELEMTLMNGSDSGVATDATNQPQVAWHQSSKAHRYMYIFGVGVLVLIALGLVAVETKLDQTTGIPRGTIVAWSGRLEDIPQGWAQCDGTNGTPDLRGKLILPATANHPPAQELYLVWSTTSPWADACQQVRLTWCA